jgi:2-polyprenyl-6-methoxyphenol hydroxylase-like FAD-dependent oxidoreductase
LAGVLWDRTADRVTGVRLLDPDDRTAEETLVADLLVDATGRGSHTPARLAASGYPRPGEERIGVGLAYATRTYRVPRGSLGADHAVAIGATADRPRGAILQLVEGGRAIVTLVGRRGDDPPTDPDGFVAFARTLRSPDIGDLIGAAEPLDGASFLRFPASVRRRYERVARFPAGLLVVGDAVCSFNPVYAQGMTVAALEAIALRRHLETGTEPGPRRYFREIARIVDVPWAIAAGADLALPGVDGRRTLMGRALTRYVTRLHAVAAHDAGLAASFIRVAGLVDHPRRLLRPRIALRVLRGASAASS